MADAAGLRGRERSLANLVRYPEARTGFGARTGVRDRIGMPLVDSPGTRYVQIFFIDDMSAHAVAVNPEAPDMQVVLWRGAFRGTS